MKDAGSGTDKEGVTGADGRVESRHGWIRSISSASRGELVFQGEYTCPVEAVSVKGCNLAINVSPN